MTSLRGGPTLLVGLGGIGMGYDLITPDDDQGQSLVRPTVRTHAAAISACDSMELVGGLDPRPERRAEFERAFGRPAWPSFDEIPDMEIETLVLAVPTSRHVEVVSDALTTLSPRLLLCEKPAGMTAADTRAILSAAELKGTTVIVNYFRHYLPTFRKVRDLLLSGAFGELSGGSVLYSHGLRRNGSHFVALLLWLFGDVDVSRRVKVDGTTLDPVFELGIGQANLTFASLGHGNVRAAEIFLGFSRGLLRIHGGGSLITWSEVDQTATNEAPSYSWLKQEWEYDMFKCQLPIYEHLASADSIFQVSVENIRVALRTQEIIAEILVHSEDM